MERQEVFKFIKVQYGIEPDYPWKDRNAVLRHMDSGKWYGLVMEVKLNKLGIKSDEPVDVLNLKCNPILIGALLTQHGFHPAYHMNKDKWITVRLDGSVSSDEIKSLIAMSYELTEQKTKCRIDTVKIRNDLKKG